METWTDALTGLYNSCLTAPCGGHHSPPSPDTAPERPPLPLTYTEYQYYNRRRGFQHNPVAQNSHHRVEWDRESLTDSGQNSIAQQVFKRVQRSNQHNRQYQNNNVFSKADTANIDQLYKHSAPRTPPGGQVLYEWCSDGWAHDSESYLSVEMNSPTIPTRNGHPVVEIPDSESESEYFTPRITPRALRGQGTSPRQENHNWGRGQGTSPRQENHTWGRGQGTSPRQENHTWGRGQGTSPRQENHTWGRGQVTSPRQENHTWGRGQGMSPRQENHTWGRGQGTSPRQENHTWGRSGPEPPPMNHSQGLYYHTLPAPRSKMVISKPRLCISPQGVKISVVEKPMSMRATITPTSPPNASPPSQHYFYPIQHHMKKQPSNRHRLSQHQKSQGGSSQQQTQRLVHQPSPVRPSPYASSCMVQMERSQSQRREEAVVANKESNSGGLKSQVHMKPKNVFGQPLVPATLRAAQSPQLTHKNKVEEDLRKLLIVDDVVKNHRKVTNIDGTLFKHPEDSTGLSYSPAVTQAQASPAFKDGSSSPHINRNGFGLVSELSETAARDMKTPEDQVPPLEAPSNHEWDRLINVKDKMAPICTSEYQNEETGTAPETHLASHHPPEALLDGSTMLGDDSEELTRQLHYLETILGELKSDLSKERRDKLALLAEVESLRKNNHHLLEESLFAYEELHKLKSMFSIAPGDTK
ncbi:uncharacterized protein LOC116221517 isoform X2 [Clupea harengus]|uniref:Uncharacterized protein LOC116221517 isoform X2 n=1 Tax=Clupea harengus TaxID=7950 RepID=A0A6P8FPF1_CLUHA|nr:uncharacterized protein LOC116221517 isoform X2 [Clupea harengus]